jgi:hypothetical protein
MTQTDPVQALRIAAIRERLGPTVGSDQLIKAALDALIAGVESPALAQLAGLGRSEEPAAHALFSHVIDELELAPALPDNPTAARWELIRWWCQLIIDGKLPVEIGGRLIWLEGWDKLNYPDALQPLVGWVSEWEDWTDAWDTPHDTYRQRIINAARELLEQPWPAQAQ